MNWYKTASNQYINDYLIQQAEMLSDSSCVHELNNIKSTYIGSGELLEKRVGDQAKILAIYNRAEARLKKFINDRRQLRLVA